MYECDACGGYIAPVWESPPPVWLTEKFYGFLAIRVDRTDTYEIAGDLPVPFGANMAFRSECFSHYGLFDVTEEGPGTYWRAGKMAELFDRIRAGGGKIMFFGSARVHHAVEGFRLTKRYFRRWRFQTSRNVAASPRASRRPKGLWCTNLPLPTTIPGDGARGRWPPE